MHKLSNSINSIDPKVTIPVLPVEKVDTQAIQTTKSSSTKNESSSIQVKISAEAREKNEQENAAAQVGGAMIAGATETKNPLDEKIADLKEQIKLANQEVAKLAGKKDDQSVTEKKALEAKVAMLLVELMALMNQQLDMG